MVLLYGIIVWYCTFSLSHIPIIHIYNRNWLRYFTMSYLYFATFFVIMIPNSVHAVGQSVTFDPLIRVLPALSSYALHSHWLNKVDLQPLSGISLSSAPGPAVIQSSVPGSQCMVVVSCGGHKSISDTFVLQAKRHSTTICSQQG